MPFKESGIPKQVKPKVSQEQQAVPETPAKKLKNKQGNTPSY
ncbi:MAG: hypothetical protein NT091_02690 [Candidatus Falkowbacteria bacterium]|nr:hypothetical protein [Candidatus Falkowbacteria bacterium]